MARGLIENWKQPIFYDFDCNMKVSILNNIITELDKIEYTVVAIVSDMSATNQKLWKSLSIGLMKTWFEHPVCSSKRIFVFADVPHLLKLVRNHFLDDGFILNGKFITCEPVKEALDILGEDDLKMMHKVSNNHLDVHGPGRQKVKTAAQLMSHSVSSCLRRCFQLGKLKSKNVLDCADFIKSVNDWFDILNSKTIKIDSRGRMKAYGIALDEQNTILDDIDRIMLDIVTTKKKTMLPFQKGIIVTNSSLRKLYKYLQKNYKIEFVLTSRLNQDVLENFFGTVRAKGGLNDHPTNLEFKYRLRAFLLGKNRTILHSSKIEDHNNSIDEVSMLTEDVFHQITMDDEYNDMALGQCDEEIEFDELHLDSLENLAGYILKKSKNVDISASIAENSVNWTWVDELSEGGLIKPSEQFTSLILKLENIFTASKSKIIRNRNVLKKLLNLSTNIPLNENVKKLFFRCRIYFLIKEKNKKKRIQKII